MKCKECCWFESQRTEPDSFDFETETRISIELGICRRHPPQQFVFPSTGETAYCWPTTRSTDWCGEWEEITPSELTLEVRIIQVLKNWLAAQDGKPMPMWRLERKLRITKTELRPVLDQLVASGSVGYVYAKTKGRPTCGYYLTEK